MRHQKLRPKNNTLLVVTALHCYDIRILRIIVATQNESKIDIVTAVCNELFSDLAVEVSGKDIPSGVAEAPHDAEIYQGALNRALSCTRFSPDFSVGIESGLATRNDGLYEETWAIIIDSSKRQYSAYSSGLPLPHRVTERMKVMTHDKVMEELDSEFMLPQNNRNTWSRYTGGVLERNISLYEALRNAFVQTLLNEKNLYYRG